MMLPSRRLLYSQQWHIDHTRPLGYHIDIKIMSYGICGMAMQAFLVNNINQFDERFFLLAQFSADSLFKKMEETKQQETRHLLQAKLAILRHLDEHEPAATYSDDYLSSCLARWSENKKKQFYLALDEKRKTYLCQLSLEEQMLLSIEPLLATVPLTLDPWLYPPLRQASKQIPPLLAPAVLQYNGDVQKVLHFSGLYNRKELKLYFHHLLTYLEQHQIQQPIALLLSNHHNSIMIGYDPQTHLWKIADPNRLPSRSVQNEDELVHEVMAGFTNYQCVALSTDIFITHFPRQTSLEEKALHAWQQAEEIKLLHAITAEKAQHTDTYFGSWLFIAAQEGEHEIAKSLIEKGANPNIRLDNGSTPFLIAAQRGDSALVEFMLAHKAVIDQQDAHGMTALYLAITEQHVDTYQLLLKQGANPNKPDNTGMTPLHVATLYNDLAAIKALIYYGANANIAREVDSLTPLHLAVKLGNLAIVNIFIIEADANPDEQRACIQVEEILHFANEEGCSQEIKQLINSKRGYLEWSLPNVLADLTELHLAAIFGYPPIVQQLLIYGADYQKTSHGITPIEFARAMDREEIVQIIQLKIFQDLAESLPDSPRCEAICKFNDIHGACANSTTLHKEYIIFKTLDDLAQQLSALASQYTNTDTQKTMRLMKHINAAYHAYASGQHDDNVIHSLSKEALRIGKKMQQSYHQQAGFLRLFNRRKQSLAKHINTLVEKKQPQKIR